MSKPTKKNNGVNLLFLNPPPMPYGEMVHLLDRTSDDRHPTCGMPVGLMDLAAYTLQHCKIDNIQIIDYAMCLATFYLNRDKMEPIDYIEFLRKEINAVDFIPDVVGVSAMFNCTKKSSLEIVQLAKETWGDCVTIIGGNLATGQYKNLLENDFTDYIARGEGEMALRLFIDSFNDGDKHPSVKGIVDKDDVIRGEVDVADMLHDLTDLPMPAFNLVNLDFYRAKNYYGRASLMFSRGCPYPCTFCGSAVVHGRKVRHKSIEQCVAELKYLLDRGFSHIKPEDDIWAINKAMFFPLVDEIEKLTNQYDRKIVFELSQGLSVAVMDEEKIDAILRMGVPGAQLAIESGSPYVQKYIIKKNVNLDKARRLLQYMRKVDFVATVNFILGFPRETAEMREETISYMKTLDVNWVFVFSCAPIMGTELFAEFEKVADMTKIDWDNLRTGRRTFDTEDLSAREVDNIVYDANINVNFFNNYNFDYGRYELAIEMWNENALSNYPFHTVGRYCRAMAYIKLGRMEEAITEFDLCVKWIGKSTESKRLYDRYKLNMPILTRVVEEGGDINEAMAEYKNSKVPFRILETPLSENPPAPKKTLG